MKQHVLFALWACHALLSPVHAQTTEEYRDTLIITPNETMKVLFIGSNMNNLSKYTRADSLKDYLLADIETARRQSVYPEGSRLTHYIVHSNGRRRLKAENEDYQEPALDLEKEVRSMNLHLPAYAYIIYDIAAACELQIYLSSPDDLKNLEQVNLSEAIRTVAAGKRSERRFSVIELKQENGQWKRTAAYNKKGEFVELTTTIGAGVFGGQAAPEVGIELSYVISDRHSVPAFRIGTSARYAVFSDYANKEFSNLYEVNFYNVSCMFRAPNSSVRWLGFELGYTIADGGSLDRNYSLGILYGLKSVQLGFNFYSPDLGFRKPKGSTLYGFVVRSMF